MIRFNRNAVLALSLSVVAAGATGLVASPAFASSSRSASIEMTVPGTGVDVTDVIDQNGDVLEQSTGVQTDTHEAPVVTGTQASHDATTPEPADPTEAPEAADPTEAPEAADPTEAADGADDSGSASTVDDNGQSGDHQQPSAPVALAPSAAPRSDESNSGSTSGHDNNGDSGTHGNSGSQGDSGSHGDSGSGSGD
jgi:hypothetical protein